MVIARALLLAAALIGAAPAAAQSGGIQVAPVLVQMAPERAFGSLRVRNGRDRATAFEVDVYAWTQVNGEDVLTPTNALVAAPGVFEMQPGGEQVVRLGAVTPDRAREIAFRVILRELPTQRADGARLGFSLEMSLPVFVTPESARPELATQAQRGADLGIILNNTGAAHARLISLESIPLEGVQGGALEAPRYLLAGAQVATPLPQGTRSVRLRLYEGGAPAERIVQIDDARSNSSVH